MTSSLPWVSLSWGAGLWKGQLFCVLHWGHSGGFPLPLPTLLLHLLCPPTALTTSAAHCIPTLFVSPIRWLARCCNLWFAGQLPWCSCCDLHSWRSRLLHYSWWPGGPVTSSVHPQRPNWNLFSQFPSFPGLLQNWHTRTNKNSESFCVPRNESHQNKPRSVAKLWFSFPTPHLPLLQSYGPSSFNAVLSCWLKQHVIFWMADNIWQ